MDGLYIEVIGNLTADAETNTLPDGKIVHNFTIATNDAFDKRAFVDCEWWGEQGFVPYMTKGRQLRVTGEGRFVQWAPGQERFRVVVRSVQGGRKPTQHTNEPAIETESAIPF